MRENSVGGIVLFLKNAHTSEDDLNQTEFANLTVDLESDSDSEF